jgi:hypothetical protein
LKTASIQKSSLFGGIFDRTTTQSTNQVASADTSQDNFFTRLFKPKSDTAQQPAAPQGAALAGLRPAAEARKVEVAKSEPQKTEPQKPQAPVAAAPRPSPPPQAPQAPQVASATTPPPSGSPIKGAQPVVPTGSFDSRWAGLQ